MRTCLACGEAIPAGGRGPICDACIKASLACVVTPDQMTAEEGARLERNAARLAAMPEGERRRTLKAILGCVT